MAPRVDQGAHRPASSGGPRMAHRSWPVGPPAEITQLERSAARHETRCGEGTMVWRTWGEGPPVLLLHGSHGSWMHWVRNIPALATGRQVWVPDLPGYGESAPPPVITSPQSHAAVLATGLRALGIDAIDVVAFSLGALLGSHLAAAEPGLVRRLVLVDVGGLGTFMRFADLSPLRGLEVDSDEWWQAQHRNLMSMMLHDEASVDDVALWAYAKSQQPTSRVHFELVPDKLVRVLPQITAQIDAIWGEHDWPHPDPSANGEVLRNVQPQAEVRVVPGAGHWAMFEGATAFNEHASDLLDQPLRVPRPGTT